MQTDTATHAPPTELADLVTQAIHKALRSHQPIERLGYSFEAAATALGVNRQVIVRLHQAGKLKPKKIGKRWIIPRRQLLALIGEVE